VGTRIPLQKRLGALSPLSKNMGCDLFNHFAQHFKHAFFQDEDGSINDFG